MENGSIDEENRKIIERRFWQRMQAMIGLMPGRVIAIMNFLGLSACNSLATERDWGALVVADIRQFGKGFFDEAVNSGKCARTDQSKIFGPHKDDFEHFALSSAEETSINAVARAVQERGILYFICEEQVTVRPSQTVHLPAGPRTPSQNAAQPSLAARLNAYFNTKPEYFGPNAFDDVRVTIIEEALNIVKVYARCIGCQTSLRCTRTNNIWHISNFVQHVKRKHKPRPNSDGIHRRTRSRLQLPSEEDEGDSNESVFEEETFSEGGEESFENEEAGDEEYEEDEEEEEDEDYVAEEDTELAAAAEQATVGSSGTEATLATTDGSRRSVSELVDIFSAGPSTSRGPKN